MIMNKQRDAIQEEKNHIVAIATFIALYSSTSYFCTNVLSETVKTVFYICTVIIVATCGKLAKKNVNALIFAIFLSVMGLTSSILANDSFSFLFSPVINMILAAFFVYFVEFDKFKKAYTNIMYYVSAFSIIVFVIYKLSPTIIQVFPSIKNTANYNAYNLFFAVIQEHSFSRLQGFFWEPGAFQTFANIALCFEIFRDKICYKRIFVLLIAIVLSFSTTGYIVAIFNVMLFLLRKKKSSQNKIITLILLFVAGISILYIIYPFVPKTMNGITFGFEKIERFFNPVPGYYDSSSVRHDSILYPFMLFCKYPILGAGYNGLESLKSIMGHGMVTCTPINYFATYGLFYGIIVHICIYSIGGYLTNFKIEKYIIFSMILLSLFTEQYMNYYIIDIFLVYGAMKALSRIPII